MTYTMFGGMLNLAQLLLHFQEVLKFFNAQFSFLRL